MSKIYLKVPELSEMHFRQEWMNDSKTMNYNAGYNDDIKGYDKATGIISKTDEELTEWFHKWINKEPDKYFAYIYDEEIEEPIGEVYYYLNNDIHSMGILIQDKYRGRGYSKESLKLLCDKAKENGIKELYDKFEIERENTLQLFMSFGFKVINKTKHLKFDKEVDVVEVKINL